MMRHRILMSPIEALEDREITWERLYVFTKHQIIKYAHDVLGLGSWDALRSKSKDDLIILVAEKTQQS